VKFSGSRFSPGIVTAENETGENMTDKPTVTLPGKVESISEAHGPSEPEKAQIAVDGGDPLYREIRIENILTDRNGEEVRLKEGAEVEVIVEADKSETVPVSVAGH